MLYDGQKNVCIGHDFEDWTAAAIIQKLSNAKATPLSTLFAEKHLRHAQISKSADDH